jgi:predicted permease
MPSGFHPDVQSELWVPLQADPNSTNQGHYLYAAARLKPNVSLEQARAEMKVVGERFRKDNPKWMDKLESVAVVPLQEATVREVHSLLLILLGAVGFVLLIACANIANLLLARATGRQREVAIRAAIGADRWRIVRQLLTESILLAAVGAVLGFALGVAGVRTLLAMVPGNIPRLTQNGIAAAVPLLDWRVAAFTLGVAVVTGILFGLMPALQAANPELASTLKEASGRSGTGLKHNRARAVLVMTEVALAVVLLIGAALLIRTFISLRAVQPGFDAHNVLTFQTSLSGAAYDTTAKQAQFILQVSQRLEALPGIEAVTAAVALPTQTQIDLPFTIAGKEPSQGNAYNGDEQYRFISYGYLKALHIPLLRGRAFNRQDTGTSAPVVMINQEFAKRYWPKEDPVGRIITIGKGLGPEFEDPPRQIIGVVGNVKETGLSEKDTPVMYVPQTQLPQGLTRLASQVLPMKWAVRTVTDPIASRSLIEREIHAVDGQMPPAKVQPFQQLLGENMARQNFNMLLLSIFAGVALILAAIGIYGVISYSVEQRTQELGIRMALGAKHSEVLGLVVRQGMLLTGAGIVLGLGAAFALTRLLASFLFGVTAYDPVTFVFVPLTLALVAFSATYLPARRVLRIDPMEALRYE